MDTSRFVCAVLITGLVLIAGCRQDNQPGPSEGQSPPSARRAAPSAPPAAQAPQVAREPQPQPQPGTAEAVTQKANSYARNVEQMLAGRAGQPQSSRVRWPDPDDLHLTARAVQAQDSTPAAAKADSGGSDQPNQGIATERAAPATRPAATRASEAAQASIEGTVIPSQAPTSDALAEKFTQRIKDYPQDVAGHIEYQLLKFLQEDSVPLLPALTPLPAEDRELVSALMDGLSNLRTMLRSDENVLFGKKIRPLIDLAERLRGQAELSIPTLALCGKVNGFGSYEPYESARFIAGKAHEVVVYCEVENLSAQLNEHKMWEARLNEEIVLYTESQGLPVWSDRKTNYLDLTHARRHDFFVAKKILLPANLTLGRYLLKVSIEDQQVKRIAENTVAIEIVAQ